MAKIAALPGRYTQAALLAAAYFTGSDFKSSEAGASEGVHTLGGGGKGTPSCPLEQGDIELVSPNNSNSPRAPIVASQRLPRDSLN